MTDSLFTADDEESIPQASSYGRTERGTHILFVPAPPKPKTKVWWVLNKYDSAQLGWIGWFARWRKYGFYPKEGTVYEETCLREIAAFCEQKSKERDLRP